MTTENYLTNYWKWLDSIDKRVSEILVALDDEMCSGRTGSRENFPGDLEYRLLIAANDGKDFIQMYKTVFIGMDGCTESKIYEIEMNATKIYNIHIAAIKWFAEQLKSKPNDKT